MKDNNIAALEKLGYTNVRITDGGIPRIGMANVFADQEITVTHSELFELVKIEVKWNEIRLQRNELLKETDWVGGTDVPQAIKDVMNPYREALRNITSDYDNPEDVVFPEKPEI